MKMPGKQLLCSICAFLYISFSALAGPGDGTGPELAAALCEMASWESPDKAARDSLLLEKARFLEMAGQSSRAYETLCRISTFGLDEDLQRRLMCLKLTAAYEAGMIDEFQALLDEASATGLLDTGSMLPSGKPRKLNEYAAQFLSLIPGAGHAYVGDWPNAGKYFLLNGSVLALGTGAFLSGLYISTFLGGGMLLHATLLKSTDLAVGSVSARNEEFLKEYYSPVYEEIKLSLRNQGTPEP